MPALRRCVLAASLAALPVSLVPAALACGGPPQNLWSDLRQRPLIAVAVVADVTPVPPPERGESDARRAALVRPRQRITARLVEVWSGDAAFEGRTISFERPGAAVSGSFLLFATRFGDGLVPSAWLGPIDGRARRAAATLIRRGLALLPPADHEEGEEEEEKQAEETRAGPDAAALADWLVDACEVAPVRHLALLALRFERDPADRRLPLSGMLLFSHQQRLANVLLDAADAGARPSRLSPYSVALLLDLLESYPSALVDRAAVRMTEAFLADPDTANDASIVVVRVLRRLGQGERAALDGSGPEDPQESWETRRARYVAFVRNQWESARRDLAPSAPFIWAP